MFWFWWQSKMVMGRTEWRSYQTCQFKYACDCGTSRTGLSIISVILQSKLRMYSRFHQIPGFNVLVNCSSLCTTTMLLGIDFGTKCTLLLMQFDIIIWYDSYISIIRYSPCHLYLWYLLDNPQVKMVTSVKVTL